MESTTLHQQLEPSNLGTPSQIPSDFQQVVNQEGEAEDSQQGLSEAKDKFRTENLLWSQQNEEFISTQINQARKMIRSTVNTLALA